MMCGPIGCLFGTEAVALIEGRQARMSQKETRRISETSGPLPKHLERLSTALRAAEVARNMIKLAPARPAETYGKIRDDRSATNRIFSAPQ